MENNILVGLLVGLFIGTSIYVWNSESFTKLQKIILLCCVLFPPLHLIGILAVLFYNNYKINNSVEKVAERKVEQVKNNLNSSISNLTDLKQKGILTEEEYKQKIKKLEAEKTEQNLKNSLEYKQLKSLLDSGILTKEEFESKLLKIEESVTLFKIEGCYIVDYNKFYFNSDGTFKIEYKNKNNAEGFWSIIDDKTIKIKLNSIETVFKNITPTMDGFSYINGKTNFNATKCI